ncbi:uncharacterized protein ASPGLDRAFT_437181 [Aspergillus glaucus CBS 516.65]|uniref:Uncharacterized protein n=1 Tax=Aspergillus glaucus CBS 516.65 TaxID=1160497 RepID=A0A1L9VGE4_ASPGL|nr:hypothetical protein ASPGLDRAFT_437181 [Aspergillus glaucus CBS 516.65]OJJ82974.1 hypothetical protein ASPGLDRAFT_437181 [Aspergillus glaucus CBS 516.65]
MTYGMVSEHFARKHQLERISIKPRAINDYKGPTDDCIKEVAKISLNVGGNHQDTTWLYVVPKLGRGLNMILGLAWMDDQQVYIDSNGPKLRFANGIVVSNVEDQPRMDIQPIGANAFALWNRQKKKDNSIQVFAASLKDVEKALHVKNDKNKVARHVDFTCQRIVFKVFVGPGEINLLDPGLGSHVGFAGLPIREQECR